jgi:hypothetical protein
MVSHTYSKEAGDRATQRYYEKNRDKIHMRLRTKYYSNPEARQKKLDKSKQRVYEEGTIRFIRLLFIQ